MCSILNGTIKNYFINSIQNALESSIPGFFHACPYYGKVKAFNVVLDSSKIPSIFPSGSYRSRVNFYDKTDDNLMTLVTQATCSSPIKSSF